MTDELDDPSDPVANPDESASTDEQNSSEPEGTNESEAGEPTGSDDNAGIKNRPSLFRSRSTILTIAVLSAVTVFINWPLRYVEVTQIGDVKSQVDFPLPSDREPVMAGLPFRYWIQLPAMQNTPSVNVFSAVALAANLACAAVIVALLTFYVRHRTKRLAGRRGINVSIADLLLLTSVLAVGLGVWQFQSAQSKAARVYRTQVTKSGGQARVSSYIPQLLTPVLPTSAVNLFLKVRCVRLENPSDEQIKTALSHPHLTSLRVGGGKYDLRLLDELSNKVHLIDLRISGQKLDTGVIKMLATHQRLQSLNLMRTNITSETLGKLENLRSLKQLNLVHSDVHLAELGRPAWADNIRELVLPRPRSGEEDELTIEGWPLLQILSIEDLDEPVNAAPMTIRLGNLEKLTDLRLDQLQSYRLDLENLPKLAQVKTNTSHWQSRIARGGSIPGALWIKAFRGIDLPQLNSLAVYVADLESLEIQAMPALTELLCGAFRNSTEFHYADRSVVRSAAYVELAPEVRQALIDGIGRSEGPELVDLDALTLSDTDLSPLAENQGIGQLYLAGTGLSPEQLQPLSKMTNLTYLRVGPELTSPAGVDLILNLFSNLEVLESLWVNNQPEYMMTIGFADEAAGPPKFRLVDRPKLRSLKLANQNMLGGYYDSVTIDNVPNLAASFDFQWVQRELLVRGADSLTGLSVASPLPPTVKLEDLKGLKYFAAGGERLDDQVINSLMGCESLEKVTLAYAGASSSVLQKLPASNLKALFLPGCKINDEVVSQWGQLPNLEAIDVSQTQITAASLPALLASSSLKTVKLDNCSIGPADLTPLNQLEYLHTLSLENVGITAETLGAILQHGRIRRLDLSGINLSDEIMDMFIGRTGQLELLVVRDCQLNSQKLLEIVRRSRSLLVDPTGSNLDTSVYSALLSNGRVVDEAEFAQDRVFMRSMRMGNANAARDAGSESPNQDPVIDPDAFSPDNLGPSDPSGGLQPTAPASTGGFLQQLFGTGNPGNGDPQDNVDDETSPTAQEEREE